MANVWKRKDRDVWVADYRTADGKRRRLTAETKQEADKLLAKMQTEEKHADPIDSPYADLTLAEYTTLCLDRWKPDLKEKTWRSYQQILTYHVLPVLGQKRVCELTPKMVRQFLAAKRQATYGNGKRYSKNALRLIKAALSSVLTDATEEDELLTTNPALAVTGRKKKHQAKQDEKEPNPMTTDQLDAFLAEARRREQQGVLSVRFPVMWELRAKTGLRPSEAYALSTDSIDWQARTLRVEQAVSLGRLGPCKTKKSKRQVELSDGCLAMLMDYEEWVTAEAVAVGASKPFLLFPGRDGGLATEEDERYHRDLFHQVRTAAKLPGFDPYDLRATYCSQLVAANAPILHVAEQMGHKNATMILKHYGKHLPKDHTRFVNALDRPLGSLGTTSGHQVDITEGESAEVIEKMVGRVGVEPTAR